MRYTLRSTSDFSFQFLRYIEFVIPYFSNTVDIVFPDKICSAPPDQGALPTQDTTSIMPGGGNAGTTEPWYTTPTKQAPETTDKTAGLPSCYIPTYGGNAGGASCVFPFFYEGFIFGTCTKQDHDRLWCATTRYYDEDKLWGNCGGKYLHNLYVLFSLTAHLLHSVNSTPLHF